MIGSVCLVALLLLGFVGYKMVDYALIPPEVPLPENGHGVFNFDRMAANSTLTIRRDIFEINKNHMVRVFDAKNQKLVCSFLILSTHEVKVRKGNLKLTQWEFKTPIPSGAYRVKLASGEKWYGDEHTFGPHGAYKEIVQVITIPERTDYVINLTGALDGELSEKQISAKGF